MKMKQPRRSLMRNEERRLVNSAIRSLREQPYPENRSNCVASEQLKAFAFGRSSLFSSHDILAHIASCPQCFDEYSAMRSRHRLRKRLVYGFAATAACIMIAIPVWWFGGANQRQPPSQPPPVIARQSPAPLQPLSVAVDLTERAITRSDEPAQKQRGAEIVLPRRRAALSIQLATGSEDGPYEVAILDINRRVLLVARGQARTIGYVATLPVEFDLTGLNEGNYLLGIRRGKWEWQTYPVVIRQ